MKLKNLVNSISKKSGLVSVLRYLVVILGSAIYAVGFTFFLVPNQIIGGGVSGLSQIINHLLGFPVGATALVLNIPIFMAAWRGLGLRFLIMSLVGTVTSYVLVDVLTPLATMEVEPLLAAIYGGLIIGAGLGLVFRAGGTTGGSDILVRLARKRFTGVPIGQIMLVFDGAVVLVGTIVFRNAYSAMYAIIVIFIMSKTTDSILYGIDYGKQVIIISQQWQELSASIMERLGRGVTVLDNAHGGYTGEQKVVLFCVIKKQQITGLRRIIKAIDPDAFVSITDAREVLGNGFASHE